MDLHRIANPAQWRPPPQRAADAVADGWPSDRSRRAKNRYHREDRAT